VSLLGLGVWKRISPQTRRAGVVVNDGVSITCWWSTMTLGLVWDTTQIGRRKTEPSTFQGQVCRRSTDAGQSDQHQLVRYISRWLKRRLHPHSNMLFSALALALLSGSAVAQFSFPGDHRSARCPAVNRATDETTTIEIREPKPRTKPRCSLPF